MTLVEILKRTKECGDCLLWTGACNGAGQPSMHSTTARRAVYELANGPIPEGKKVGVDCGQVKCLNPKHLIARTVSEISKISNARAAVRRKRQTKTAATNRAKMGKITMDIAREIRLSDKSGLEWASELKCSPSLISLVRNNKSWVEHSSPFAGLMA